MAVHDLMRELVDTRGAGVVGDADQFRGALDDFLEEHEASRGEINLLVDAVRLGAVTRVVTMLDHGAEPGAALDEVALELARDRGADSATGARWALGVIGFALGKVPRELLGSDRPSSIPTPQRPITASPPPRVPDLPTEPTPPPSHPSFPRPESTPAPPPEPARAPAPPTNVADAPPERPGTRTIPEHATERVPDDPTPGSPPSPPPFLPAAPGGGAQERKRRGRLVAVLVVAMLVVAAGVAGFVLLSGDDDPDEAVDDADSSSEEAGGEGDSPVTSDDGSDVGSGTAPSGSLPTSAVVLPVTVDGDTSLYVLDTEDGSATPLTQGTDDRLPNVSPDRTMVVFLRPESRGTGLRSPYLLDVVTGEERPLFDDSSPCLYSGRPAWSPNGEALAVMCVNDGGGYTGTHVVGLDGQEQVEVIPDGIPDGGLTWSSDSTLIYARSDGSGSPTTLWQYDLGDSTSAQLTAGPGWDSHPDWSEENGVALFQRSAEGGPDVRGELWELSPYDGEAKLEIGQDVAHGALSADGSMLLFVVDTGDGEQLASAPVTDPSSITVYDQVPGEPGAPAGGAL